jgi:hypothetical protein
LLDLASWTKQTNLAGIVRFGGLLNGSIEALARRAVDLRLEMAVR